MFATNDNGIHALTYTDLYNRKNNAHVTLLDATSGYVSSVNGIDIMNDDGFFFTNGAETETAGTVMGATYAEGTERTINNATVKVVFTGGAGHGCTVSEDKVFFTTANRLYKFDLEDAVATVVSRGFVNPTSIAFGEKHVYVADYGSNQVYKVKAHSENKEVKDAWIGLVGVRGVHTVNTWEGFGGVLALAFALLWL
jgi:hypothetical protein